MLDSGGARERFANVCALHAALSLHPALGYHCAQGEIAQGVHDLADGERPESAVSEWRFTCAGAAYGVYTGPVFDADAKTELPFSADFARPAFDYDALWREVELARAYDAAAGLLLVASHVDLEAATALLSRVIGQIGFPGYIAILLPDENALLKRIFANHKEYSRAQYMLLPAPRHSDGSAVGLEENDFVAKELAADPGYAAVNAAVERWTKTKPAWFYSHENALLWLIEQASK